ncbi:MAG: heme o synthase [Planctomycetota bacterium]|jgi:protoheme IX farnesyltransferase
MRQLLRDLMVMTKLRINMLGIFTGYAAIAIFEVLHPENPVSAIDVTLCLLAMLLVGGAANTWNQIIEKDKDSRMERTREKRPIPSGRISVPVAWAIALVQFVASLAIFAFHFQSVLATVLALVLVLYYSVFYTMFLKPWHYLNIVVGGVPGAMGPLLAWAAVSHDMAWEPVALFAIIFLWTPPHFWPLAIRLRDDYRAAGIPMLPVAKGVDETTRQIFIYTVIMVVATVALPLILPVFQGAYVYWSLAVLGGAIFLRRAWVIWRRRPMPNTMPLFHYSLLYIGALFLGVIVDAALAETVVPVTAPIAEVAR